MAQVWVEDESGPMAPGPSPSPRARGETAPSVAVRYSSLRCGHEDAGRARRMAVSSSVNGHLPARAARRGSSSPRSGFVDARRASLDVERRNRVEKRPLVKREILADSEHASAHRSARTGVTNCARRESASEEDAVRLETRSATSSCAEAAAEADYPEPRAARAPKYRSARPRRRAQIEIEAEVDHNTAVVAARSERLGTPREA